MLFILFYQNKSCDTREQFLSRIFLVVKSRFSGYKIRNAYFLMLLMKMK